MALRYRNEHVIDNLRAAYSLKHRDDSLLSDDNIDTISSHNLNEIEAYIASLNSKGRRNSVPDTSALKYSTERSSRSNSVGATGKVNLRSPGSHNLINDDEVQDSELLSNGSNNAIANDFSDMKSFDLDIEDESDYEDNLLRATREIKQNSQAEERRHSSSTSSASYLKQPHQFNYQEVFSKRGLGEDGTYNESRLTSQLTDTRRDPRDQYLEALAGLKTSGIIGLNLSMHISAHPSVRITVNPSSSTHLAIGYALLVANISPGDANMYNLRLAEDDGEPDEDFPALDRTRPVASYQVDEFALVKATDSEFRENCKRTPNKMSFKSKVVADGASSIPRSSSPRNQQSELSNSLAGLRTGPMSRPKLTQLNSFNDTKSDLACIKIYMHPYDPIFSQVFWADDMVQKNTVINDIFEQMCKEKMMDSDMYVLRTAEPPHQIVNNNTPVLNMVPALKKTVSPSSLVGTSSAEEQFESSIIKFELIARRNLQGAQGSLSKPSSVSQVGAYGDGIVDGRVLKSKRRTTNELQNAVMAMQPLGFYKYSILRRQQMNFLGRSERELVIDGEYIHIMPPADWSILDQPKTTTFHIRQVLRVKRSRKTITNFSIIVLKASGPKRYDLESKDASTTMKIVEQLQHLKESLHKNMT